MYRLKLMGKFPIRPSDPGNTVPCPSALTHGQPTLSCAPIRQQPVGSLVLRGFPCARREPVAQPVGPVVIRIREIVDRRIGEAHRIRVRPIRFSSDTIGQEHFPFVPPCGMGLDCRPAGPVGWLSP
jgi:hypothetical protein